MTINNEEPSTVKGCIKVINNNQIEGKPAYITMTLCKRKERNKTLYNSIRSLFKQIKYKIEQDVIEPNVNSLDTSHI